MASVQTAYTEGQPIGAAGQVASQHRHIADSLVVETEAGIGFGLVVSPGAAARGIVIGGSAPFAVTVRDVTKPNTDGDKYIETALAAGLCEGDIWVLPVDAVAPGDPVRYNPTTGALGTGIGTTLKGARWLTSAAAGDPAMLRVGGRGFGKASATAPPTNSVAPALSGTEQVGNTLTVSDGTWAGSPTFTYAWYRDDVLIAGETANTYDLIAEDEGAIINAVVTATNAGGSASAPSDDTAAIAAA